MVPRKNRRPRLTCLSPRMPGSSSWRSAPRSRGTVGRRGPQHHPQIGPRYSDRATADHAAVGRSGHGVAAGDHGAGGGVCGRDPRHGHAGLGGVMAYTVSRRRREIGLRMALGALGRDVALAVVRSAARLILAGSMIGILCSYAGAQCWNRCCTGSARTIRWRSLRHPRCSPRSPCWPASHRHSGRRPSNRWRLSARNEPYRHGRAARRQGLG